MNVNDIFRIQKEDPELIDLILADENDTKEEIPEQIDAGLKILGIDPTRMSMHSFRIFVKNTLNEPTGIQEEDMLTPIVNEPLEETLYGGA